MSVVARQRKTGIEYYVTNRVEGEQLWEHVGRDKREAVRRDAAMKREIAAGIYASRKTAAATVGSYARAWFAKRTNRNAEREQRLFDYHIGERCEWFAGLRVEDVRRVHVKRLLGELRLPYIRRDTGKPFELSRKTVALIFGTLNVMFREACGDEEDRMMRNPCALDRHDRPRATTKKRSPYEAHEVVALTTCQGVPLPARMFLTLLFYTGMRVGEVAGRRWRDYDSQARPLGSLRVWSQYNDQPLKTEEEEGDAPRIVPVHPKLEAALIYWRVTGFELTYGRRPTDNDFIVPRLNDADGHHSVNSAYKMFVRACAVAGVKMHTVHATRNTFISLCRRDQADLYALQRVTHNAKGDVIDTYTTFDWAPLCAAVSCFMRSHEPPAAPAGNVVPMRQAAGAR